MTVLMPSSPLAQALDSGLGLVAGPQVVRQQVEEVGFVA